MGLRSPTCTRPRRAWCLTNSSSKALLRSWATARSLVWLCPNMLLGYMGRWPFTITQGVRVLLTAPRSALTKLQRMLMCEFGCLRGMWQQMAMLVVRSKRQMLHLAMLQVQTGQTEGPGGPDVTSAPVNKRVQAQGLVCLNGSSSPLLHAAHALWRVSCCTANFICYHPARAAVDKICAAHRPLLTQTNTTEEQQRGSTRQVGILVLLGARSKVHLGVQLDEVHRPCLHSIPHLVRHGGRHLEALESGNPTLSACTASRW